MTMADRRYSPGRSPDDHLREKARTLQLIKDTYPEFATRRPGHPSPSSKQGGYPSNPHPPANRGQQHRPTWSQERQRLDREKQKLQEDQDKVSQAKKRWSLPSPYSVLDPIDKRPHSNQDQWDSDIADFILKTQDHIPQMIVNLQRLKDELNKDKKELKNPAVIVSTPKSYKPWQMADYYMARDILLDLIDEAVERSERKPKPISQASKLQQQAATAAEREVDAARKQRCQERAIQLLAEELILEMTGLLTRRTIEEYLSTLQYANTLKQQLVMQSAEAAATGNPSGRAEDDPAYDLVTSTYDQMSKDRNMNRKDTWSHSQKLHLESASSDQEENVVMDSLVPDTAIPLNLLHLPIKLGRPPDRQSPELTQFKEQETAYWKMFSSQEEAISLSKKVQGVVSAVVCPHHRYLALGCLRGDLLVFSLAGAQPMPVRCIQNESTKTDAIIHIAWSMDSSRLVSVNQTGILQLWSMSSGGLSQKDLRDLDLKAQAGLPQALQLTQLLALDADQSDFNFKEGPLQATGAQTSTVSPTVSVFHPSHTLLATQNTVVVGLENGDILKCNTSATPDLQNMETASHCQANLDAQANYIGHDVPTELYRCHKSSLIFLGFVGSHGNMLSMDTSGLICEWLSTRDAFSHFGWFEPSATYRLELAERVYAPRPDDTPKVLFSDSELSEKNVSRKERLAAREKASERLEQMTMEELWHKEMNTSSTELQIFGPKEVQEAGSVFHGIVRHSAMNQLLKHYTYYCQPAKNFCSRVLQVRQTPCGLKLVLMLLFPAFPPKGPHISFVVLNLSNMSVCDTRIDTSLSEEEYDRCLNQDVCSFDITPVLSATGSQYVLACIIGTVRLFSMETTLQVMAAKMEDPNSSRTKRAFADKVSVRVSMAKGNINIISYAPKYNSVDILQLADKNTVKSRQHVYSSYMKWRKRKSPTAYEQQHRQITWLMDGDTARNSELFVRRLVLQLADVAVYVSEGLDIDKDRLQQFWKEDKTNAETDLLRRIMAKRKGDTTGSQSATSNER